METTTSEIRSLSLQKLNELSLRRRFTLADATFIETPISQMHWAPMKMAPLFYLPSFSKLTSKQQTRYNQLFAIGVLEQFIWFEGDLLGVILPKILMQTRDPEMRLAIYNFLEEEKKHSEMFWRLLEKTVPDMYPERQYQLLNVGFVQSFGIWMMKAFPFLNLVWIWMAILFEERTMDYSQQYIEEEKKNPGLLNPNFVRAHQLHMMDEARHLQMDVHFLDTFYRGQSRWKKKWALILMNQVMKAYQAPRRISLRILDILKTEFHDLPNEVVSSLKEELKQLSTNTEFQEMAFGSLKRYAALFSEASQKDSN